MLSKTELLPAKDRLEDAHRHLAHVRGSIRHIKSVENKQIVNDLIAAIEAQRKAVEQMLQVLDVVARHDFCNVRFQETQGTDPKLVDRKQTRKRRVGGDFHATDQSVFPVLNEQELVPSERMEV